MTVATALVVNLVIGAASFVSSLTGFGYALVATPFMVLFFPPQLVVPVVMVSWVPLAILLVREAYPRMHPGRIAGWAAGALLGVPVGVYGLAHLDAGTMRAAIGGITLAAALTLWLRPSHPLRHERPVAVGAGLLSGVMGGATGMSGPPVILFGLNQGWEPRQLRANLIGYFAFKHAVVLVFMQGFGILDATTLLLGVTALPGMFVGYQAGIRLKERVSQKHFRALAFALVCLGGVLALIRH